MCIQQQAETAISVATEVYCMDQTVSPAKTQQEFEIATYYLNEAEEVLWNVSNEMISAEVADEVDAVLEQLWELQNQTTELTEGIRHSRAEFEW